MSNTLAVVNVALFLAVAYFFGTTAFCVFFAGYLWAGVMGGMFRRSPRPVPGPLVRKLKRGARAPLQTS